MKGEKLIKQNPINDEVLSKLNQLIGSINYGTVTIIIQDGKIIQIEKNEKFRLT